MPKLHFREDPLGPIKLVVIAILVVIGGIVLNDIFLTIDAARDPARSGVCIHDNDLVRYQGPVKRVGDDLVLQNGQVSTDINTISVCQGDPRRSQQVLEAAAGKVDALLLFAFIGLVWRLIRIAQADSYFSRRVAKGLTGLGLILVGGAAVGEVVKAQLYFALWRSVDEPAALVNPWWFAFFPPVGTLLAGALLLTFGRVMRLAWEMRDELDATV